METRLIDAPHCLDAIRWEAPIDVIIHIAVKVDMVGSRGQRRILPQQVKIEMGIATLERINSPANSAIPIG